MKKIGIDLGTTNTVVFIPKKGIIINEPSVVAISILDNKIMSVGNLAKEMIEAEDMDAFMEENKDKKSVLTVGEYLKSDLSVEGLLPK